jgi:3-hydroxyacyl-CoA dehydrogenase
VLDGVREAIARAERDFDALVIWQPQPPFSAGANLYQLAPLIMAGSWPGWRRAWPASSR